MSLNQNHPSTAIPEPPAAFPAVQSPYINFHLEHGILHIKWAEGVHITPEIARACVEKRIELSRGHSYPCLIDMRGVRSVNKEVREYMAKEGAALIKAGALLVKNPVTRTIANIFLKVNAPPVPSRLFTDNHKAIQWLKQFT